MISHLQFPLFFLFFFFFNDTATTEIYTLSLHDALPILAAWDVLVLPWRHPPKPMEQSFAPIHLLLKSLSTMAVPKRSEEHTSELQSQSNLVCRLLLEKKKKQVR